MSERFGYPALALVAASASAQERRSIRRVATVGGTGANSSPFIVRIHLLGSMQATTYLGESILPRGRKARALLAYLCLAPGSQAPRARLASVLWDRVPDLQARTSLRQSLRELALAMGKLADELITVDRETVRINTTLCWIDALAILRPKSPADNLLGSDLIGLCTGQLLEELDGTSVSFDHWLFGERTRFANRVRELLEAELDAAVESASSAGQRALIARRLIGFDPTHEGACRILMRALAEMGERAQAIREYERCRQSLRKTLDVEPSSETRALYEAVRIHSTRIEKLENVAANVVQMRPDPLIQEPQVRSYHGRLRVGVLPFLASGPVGDEGLAFSFAQEIAAALARFRWFDVIAPVSLTRTSATPLDDKEFSDTKELDYAVEGALSAGADRFYISVRLLRPDATRTADLERAIRARYRGVRSAQ